MKRKVTVAMVLLVIMMSFSTPAKASAPTKMDAAMAGYMVFGGMFGWAVGSLYFALK